MGDIERMLRDATAERWDSQPFERVAIEEVFNPGSLRWYRNRFHTANAGFDPLQSDLDFLYDWGYLIRDESKLLPTRAAVLLFGSLRGVRNLIPRPILDIQFLGYATHESPPETRWIARFVSEENITQNWEQLVAKYRFFMPKPFRDIDPVTLGRHDDPPGFRVFREAAINLLIHQDYGDHSRKAVIKFYRDGIRFWNPGDVFGDDSRLLEPGEKEVRNPAIAMAMRRIAMCEQTGTGMRMMREEWRKLGHPAPAFRNDRVRKAFELFIPELDRGVDMASDILRTMFGETSEIVHDNGIIPNQVKAQEAQVKAQANYTSMEIRLLEMCKESPRTGQELATAFGYTSRTGNVKRSIEKLKRTGVIEMTIPDKPRSGKQGYRLTEKGRRVLKEGCA